ncbi:lipase family protein [Marinagarivorans cellulosilyticus]|uniref:Fungal lipase-type domain-containing protein n=1 Tax=Marinagarivorans cellulosilyticus TaxID=2721545 RepID=A0AAN1WFX0_9GAMM|nr:lipase family protein [Marinagarivorans cellulosilyticus]BCD96800.1 hypothetical protein MARGE09_P1000 [Marinagarivorans cellulosilyticus]
MANPFTPKVVAGLCKDVYALTKIDTLDEAKKVLNTRYQGNLQFADNNMLVGKTGGPAFVKVKTAFGFVLVGQNQLAGHAFVLFRGTQYLADWLTNFNMLFGRSECGNRVHDGFNSSFKSMKPQIAPFIQGLPPGTKVHCLGHSLGGALATLAAEWIKQTTSFEVFLYSFGSPRVGLDDFSAGCTSLIGCDHVFRAYHKTDVVPCIPIWPFTHTPNEGRDYLLFSPGLLPGGKWHDMGEYVTSVTNGSSGKSLSWEKLYSNRKTDYSDVNVSAWLTDRGQCVYSLSNFQKIEHAFKFVIKKCLSVVGNMASFAQSTYTTLMDRLAFVLAKNSLVEGSLSTWITLLMKKIAQFLGLAKKLADSDNWSEAVIRDLLRKLQVKAQTMAKQALSHALADGRAL